MRTITITRYDGLTGAVAQEYGGYIEGETDDGQTWIVYLDATGRPSHYWGRRDAGGAVLGDPISLM